MEIAPSEVEHNNSCDETSNDSGNGLNTQVAPPSLMPFLLWRHWPSDRFLWRHFLRLSGRQNAVTQCDTCFANVEYFANESDTVALSERQEFRCNGLREPSGGPCAIRSVFYKN